MWMPGSLYLSGCGLRIITGWRVCWWRLGNLSARCVFAARLASGLAAADSPAMDWMTVQEYHDATFDILNIGTSIREEDAAARLPKP